MTKREVVSSELTNLMFVSMKSITAWEQGPLAVASNIACTQSPLEGAIYHLRVWSRSLQIVLLQTLLKGAGNLSTNSQFWSKIWKNPEKKSHLNNTFLLPHEISRLTSECKNVSCFYDLQLTLQILFLKKMAPETWILSVLLILHILQKQRPISLCF